MIKILAHRGQWNLPEKKNSLSAFERAFSNGYGIETDIRDYKGELVISHNIADETAPKLSELLSLLVGSVPIGYVSYFPRLIKNQFKIIVNQNKYYSVIT
jgi:hypothetical protein